ncbi:MAG: hypothetical protein ABW352_12370 [Polyangiales bacterium]
MRWLVLVCLVACASEDLGETRLKQIALQVPGAPDAVQGWYDSELRTDCSPALASDGVLRCLPPPAAFAGGLGFFRDASCSGMLYTTSTCEPSPSVLYARRMLAAGDECTPRYEVVRLVSEEQDLRTATLYRAHGLPDGSSACRAVRDQTVDAFRADLNRLRVWREAEVVPAERWVALSAPRRGVGTPAMMFDVGEDGSELPSAPVDASGTPCRPVAYEQGGFCLAREGMADPRSYADEACSVPLYFEVKRDWCQPDRPPELLLEESGSCDAPLRGARFLHVAAPASRVFLGSAEGCRGLPPAPRPHYTKGAERAPSSLTRLALRREGSGRLQALSLYNDAGELIAIDRYWDQELGIACRAERLGTDQYACLPLTLAIDGSSSSDCAQTVLNPSCAEHAPGALVRVTTRSEVVCPGVFVRRLGARLEDGPLFVQWDQPGQCSPYSGWGPDDARQARFSAGDELPLARFATLQRVLR